VIKLGVNPDLATSINKSTKVISPLFHRVGSPPEKWIFLMLLILLQSARQVLTSSQVKENPGYIFGICSSRPSIQIQCGHEKLHFSSSMTNIIESSNL
jgi:hypothetical protein